MINIQKAQSVDEQREYNLDYLAYVEGGRTPEVAREKLRKTGATEKQIERAVRAYERGAR